MEARREEPEIIIEAILRDLVGAGVIGLDDSGIAKESSRVETAKTLGYRIREKVLTELKLPNLGSYIKAEREQNGLEKTEIARKIGITSSTFSELENGVIDFFDIPVSKAVAITSAIGLSINSVLLYLTQMLRYPNSKSPTGELRLNRSKSVSEETPTIESFNIQSPVIGVSKKERIQKFIPEYIEEARNNGLI